MTLPFPDELSRTTHCEERGGGRGRGEGGGGGWENGKDKDNSSSVVDPEIKQRGGPTARLRHPGNCVRMRTTFMCACAKERTKKMGGPGLPGSATVHVIALKISS